MRSNQRVAYFNGRVLPERDVVVPFRDRGFRYGDAVFDSTRTFNGLPFRLEQHIARLYNSLAYVRIDPGLTPDQMLAISADIVARNRHLLGPNEDYWVSQRISRGVDAIGDEGWPQQQGATVIVECTPLPLKARAKLFRDGISLIVPSVRRVSPTAVSPRAKTHNYLNLVLGDLEAKAHDPDAWSLLLDERGHLAEGTGSNIFVVKDGILKTPRGHNVLPGVSRAAVIELAALLGIEFHETDLDPFDAATADEIFVTSTSLCLCPVSRFNGRKVGNGTFPGPVTTRLTRAYVELAGFDFIAQYRAHLT